VYFHFLLFKIINSILIPYSLLFKGVNEGALIFPLVKMKMRSSISVFPFGFSLLIEFLNLRLYFSIEIEKAFFVVAKMIKIGIWMGIGLFRNGSILYGRLQSVVLSKKKEASMLLFEFGRS